MSAAPQSARPAQSSPRAQALRPRLEHSVQRNQSAALGAARRAPAPPPSSLFQRGSEDEYELSFVYGPDASNADVHARSVAPLLRKLLEGICARERCGLQVCVCVCVPVCVHARARVSR